jgi:hypothetical protein
VNTQKVIWLLAVSLAACTWIAYAEHPTARNLRRAIGDTWPLL